MPHKTFETERLFLRPTAVEDAAFLRALLNSPKWIENIGDRGVRTIEDAEKYIEERIKPQLERLGFSNYTVIRKSDGAKIGTCGLYDREGLEGVDIGFAFLPEYENQGYATEAAMRIKEAGLNDFGLTTFAAITTQKNTASQKLIRKLGLVYVKNIFLPGDPEELMYFEYREE